MGNFLEAAKLQSASDADNPRYAAADTMVRLSVSVSGWAYLCAIVRFV